MPALGCGGRPLDGCQGDIGAETVVGGGCPAWMGASGRRGRGGVRIVSGGGNSLCRSGYQSTLSV